MSNLVVTNEQIKKALDKDGYISVPMLNAADVEQLMALFRKYYADDETKYFNSLYSEAAIRREVSEEIERVFKPYIDKIFDNYQYVVGLLFIKNPSPDADAEVPMHQDPTLLMDEDVNKHINIWCPLNDVDENNGALHMVAGSHLFFPGVQARTVPTPYEKIYPAIHQAKNCIRMQAGDALIFDNKILHGSMPNVTNKKRVAVVLSFAPKNAQYISIYRDPAIANAPIEVYAQQHGYHLDPRWFNTPDRNVLGTFMGLLDYEPFFVTEEEFNSLVNNPRPYKTYTYKFKRAEKPGLLARIKAAIMG